MAIIFVREQHRGIMPSQLFRLRQVELWGDYGDVLISGVAPRHKKTGELLLHRTGPFAPPVFFPWDSISGGSVVVTQTFRQRLEQAGFDQLSFRPVVKDRIIDFPWHTWDRTADEPVEHPESGEPEDYIWDGKHSRKVASEMEDMYELLPPIIPCKVEWEMSDTVGVPNKYYFTPQKREYRGLFRDRSDRYSVIVDRPSRLWFERNVNEWVGFDELIER